jgi:predicted amidohydrolase YtcJ
LAGTVDAAHAEGRAIAMHCVTRAQLVLALAAIHDAGPAPATAHGPDPFGRSFLSPKRSNSTVMTAESARETRFGGRVGRRRAGDRIEHAAVVPDELVDQLRAVTVVTQPAFIAERGDAYLSDVETDDLPFLYRCRSLLDAGVRVAAGTDAPFGAADPWASIKAAVDRRTSSGSVLGPEERLAPADALKLFLGKAEAPSVVKRIEPGAPADLCVLHCPLDAALAADPTAEAVRATVIAGDVVHDASG